MATKDKQTKYEPVEDNDDLFDLGEGPGGVPPTVSTATPMIDTPGIHHNLKVKFEYKEEKYKDQAKNPGNWKAFSVTVTNPDGLEFTEMYFSPASSVDQIKPDRLYPVKKYEIVEGKTVETRVCTPAEELKIVNNEFLAYLIDLGEALGYSNAEVKEYLYKHAKGFHQLCTAFLEKFKPTEDTRISAKILYENNKSKQISRLKIHGNYVTYYPYGNDFFDVFKPNRPSQLKLSSWEMKVGMVKQFTGTSASNAPAGDAAVNKSSAANSAEARDLNDIL